jgi:hypothetical protein
MNDDFNIIEVYLKTYGQMIILLLGMPTSNKSAIAKELESDIEPKFTLININDYLEKKKYIDIEVKRIKFKLHEHPDNIDYTKLLNDINEKKSSGVILYGNFINTQKIKDIVIDFSYFFDMRFTYLKENLIKKNLLPFNDKNEKISNVVINNFNVVKKNNYNKIEKALYTDKSSGLSNSSDTETTNTETTDKETTDTETTDKETTDKETTDKETTDTETTDKETTDKETTDKETTDTETTDTETTDTETTDKETTDTETTDKETTDKETTDKETTDKETTDKETTDKETQDSEDSEDTEDSAEKKIKKKLEIYIRNILMPIYDDIKEKIKFNKYYNIKEDTDFNEVYDNLFDQLMLLIKKKLNQPLDTDLTEKTTDENDKILFQEKLL